MSRHTHESIFLLLAANVRNIIQLPIHDDQALGQLIDLSSGDSNRHHSKEGGRNLGAKHCPWGYLAVMAQFKILRKELSHVQTKTTIRFEHIHCDSLARDHEPADQL